MKPGILFPLALLLQAPATPISHFRSMRAVVVKGKDACAVLDADVFAHAAPSLKDLRLFAMGEEIPYFITLSETAGVTDEIAEVASLASDGAQTAFDLRMPMRPYTEVDLDLRQQDFVVTATVSGADELGSSPRTPLGSFTLFDLASRHLSRSTVLALQESTFRYLHVELRGARIAPGAVFAAHVPPSRQAQTLYSTVVETADLSREGSETVASFRIPAHVPLERVSIELPAQFRGNFDRTVRVTGRAEGPDGAEGPVEAIDGKIMQVSLGKIHQRQLSFDAAMGVNLQKDATIRVAIQDGAEAPLPISSVRFEMRRRSLCFSSPMAAETLYYGDPSLPSPRYVAPSTPSGGSPLPATLGPETANPAFVERSATVPAKGSGLVWLLLLGGLGAAGTIALHTLRGRSVHRG